MKQVRKHVNTPGCCARLQTKMEVDGKPAWKSIYCPLSQAADDPCGQWCAWYDEEPIKVQLSATMNAETKTLMATCQGKPIGEIVNEDD